MIMLAVGLAFLPGAAKEQPKVKRASTDWFRQAGWGVFTHYLTGEDMSATEWNALVDGFDVPGLARQLKQTGCRYYYLTLGQNSGHYCSPNAAYDRIVGITPSKCSRRDLVADLYDALHPLGIRLMVYLPAGAPDRDPVAMERLQWSKGAARNAEFQRNWEAVIREWSQRWGKKVGGWWFDGCYWPDAMYRFPAPPNFQSFAAAAKAGNPQALVAFNPGVLRPIISLSEYEDYTAGEIDHSGDDPFPPCPGRWVEGAQWHMLSYLGSNWCRGDKPAYPDDLIVRVTRDRLAAGGVVTWDVPIDRQGHIPQPFVDQLSALGRALPGK